MIDAYVEFDFTVRLNEIALIALQLVSLESAGSCIQIGSNCVTVVIPTMIYNMEGELVEGKCIVIVFIQKKHNHYYIKTLLLKPLGNKTSLSTFKTMSFQSPLL